MNIQIFQFYSAFKASGLILSKQVFERLTPSVSLAQIGEVKVALLQKRSKLARNRF